MKKEDHILEVYIQYPELTQWECRRLRLCFDGSNREDPKLFRGRNEISEEHLGVLESTFGCFNAGSGRESHTFVRAKVRSMSVGDFVCIEAQWYKCMPVGWGKVSWGDVYGEDAKTRKSIDTFLGELEKES